MGDSLVEQKFFCAGTICYPANVAIYGLKPYNASIMQVMQKTSDAALPCFRYDMKEYYNNYWAAYRRHNIAICG